MADLMRETCLAGCDRSWGVSMPPRERVLCTPCGRPAPWWQPLAYWRGRTRFPFPPESQPTARADARTMLQDLRAALAMAEADPVMVAAEADFRAWMRGDVPALAGVGRG